MKKIIFLVMIVTGAYFLLGWSMSIKLELTSGSFDNGGEIPRQYTCDGEDVSPPLSWKISDPQKVESYVLIVDDPDAQKVAGKTFVHWIVLLSPNTTLLPEGISSKEESSIQSLDPAAKELPNDFGKSNYGGPCPTENSGEHTYRFTLFATNASITTEMDTPFFKHPFTAENFRHEMGDTIVGESLVTGKYKRSM